MTDAVRLIDADALEYESVTLPGDDEVVSIITRDDLDAAREVNCGGCGHSGLFDDGMFFCRNERAPVIGSIEDDFGCAYFEGREE